MACAAPLTTPDRPTLCVAWAVVALHFARAPMTLMLIGGVAMFAFGYVTPEPGGDPAEDGGADERQLDGASQRMH